MLRFPTSVIKPFALTHSLLFSFAKIIKMAPPKLQQSTFPIMNSLKSATQIFNKYGSSNPSNPQNFNTLESADEFIDFVVNMNMNLYEKNILTLPFSAALEIEQLYKKLDKDHIMSNVIELMISQKQFTEKTRQFLTRFVSCQMILIKKMIQIKKLSEQNIRFLGKFVQFLNQYFILLQLNDRLVMDYLFIMTYLINTHILDENRAHFINQKIVIDYLIERGSSINFKRQELNYMFQYIGMANVISNYNSKYWVFLKLIISKLKTNWEQESNYDHRRLITMYGRACYDCEKFNRGLRYFMGQFITWTNYETVISAINCYIKVKAQIFDGKPIPKEYSQPLKAISKFVRQQKNPSELAKKNTLFEKSSPKKDWEFEIYKELIPNLFRSSIWLEKIWFDFAEWLQTGENYKKVRMINLVSIFQLMDIDKDIIPESVRERLLKSKNFLLKKHNLRIDNTDLIKVYFRQFGDRLKGYYTVQQQITNALRSVSRKNVKSEVLIRLFLVDILIDEKVVIEINNQLHYIENDRGQQKISNLKSAFRKRILQKLGYKVLEYEIDTITEGNFEFISNVQKQLEQFEKQAL